MSDYNPRPVQIVFHVNGKERRVDVSRLQEFHAAEPQRIIIPCHGGRRGHPVLVPRLILEELQGDLTLRDLVRRNPDRLHCIEVDDPGILIDMDTPEDYRRIRTMIQTNEELLETI